MCILNLCISACSTHVEGDFIRVHANQLQELQKLELQGTTILFNSAITALGRSACWELAMALVTKLAAKGLARHLLNLHGLPRD